jgi:hypothetical protein
MLRKVLTVCSLVVAFVFFASLVVAQDTNTGGPASFASGGSAPAAATPGTTGGSVQAIQFDLSPGTGAPPATLGGFSMTPVPSPGAPACTGVNPPLPTSGGGTIGIAPFDGVHRCVGAGWNTWSHGYVGDVYSTGGPTSQTLTFPSGTRAVYFYVEPDPLSAHDFTVVAQPGDVSSGAFSVVGSGGAQYVGVFGTAGSTVTSATITSSADFAVGEFGWAPAGGGACDPNGDGHLDAKDAVALLRLLLQGTPLPVDGDGNCNGDIDGVVGFRDLLALLKLLRPAPG